jgi:hypothetical protein
MFKFSKEAAAGLRKLGQDMYNVTHRKKPNPEANAQNQFQPNINNTQPTQTQTTLPISGTPTVVNNIYNNIPPMTQTVTNYTKKFSLLKTILYAAILTIIVLALWYMITNGGIGNWLNQGIGKLHEILTTIF